MYLLCIYDKKAETYGAPIIAPNLAVATRNFAAACQDKNSIMAKFPEDIEIKCIGTFDERTGKIEAKEIVTISAAKEFVQKGAENGKGNDRTNNNGDN